MDHWDREPHSESGDSHVASQNASSPLRQSFSIEQEPSGACYESRSFSTHRDS